MWKGDVSKTFTVGVLSGTGMAPFSKSASGKLCLHATKAKSWGSDPSAPLRNPWVAAFGVAANDKDVLKQLGRARKPKEMH